MPAGRLPIDSLRERDFRRILLIKPSSLGDVVHALPVLHALRSRYPDARIDWLISNSLATLLEGHPQIDELLLFDRRRFQRVGRSPAVTAAFVRFLRDLRGRRYDLVIDLQGLFRTAFFARVSGARVRIGFRQSREGARLFYSHLIPDRPPNAHAVDRNLAVSELLGSDSGPARFGLHLPEEEVTAAEGLLRDVGLAPDRPYLAIAPGARWETKVWPAERFAQAVDELSRSHGMPAVVLGSPDERETCARVIRASRSGAVDLAGKTSLLQLAALVRKCSALLCHDSAAAHLAVAFGRPLVCVVGPTNHLRTGPYRRPEAVVRLDLECAPCYLRRLARCRHGHRCMQDLGVEQVVEAVHEALRAHPPVQGAEVGPLLRR